MSSERDGLRRRSALSLQIMSPVEDQSDAHCDDGFEVRRWCTRRCNDASFGRLVDPNVGLARSSGYWGLVRSWHDLIDHRGIHWRGDFGRYQPTSEKSLKDSGAMSQNDARLQSERATEAK
jgi:hypothetical protein